MTFQVSFGPAGEKGQYVGVNVKQDVTPILSFLTPNRHTALAFQQVVLHTTTSNELVEFAHHLIRLAIQRARHEQWATEPTDECECGATTEDGNQLPAGEPGHHEDCPAF